jgi:soluble lytic murein transglycosylase-like protein
MKSLAPKLRNQWVSQQRAQMGYPGTALSAIPGLAAWGVIPAPTSGGLRGYQALRPVLLQAAKAAGVPLSWVDDPAFIHLIGDKESGFNPLAQNPRSSAFGIFQFLDATRRTYGIPKTSDPYIQSVAGFKYLRDRYGSPAAALAFHNAHNWY